MSHKIGEYDRQEGIKQAWHGLTHVRESIGIADNWLSKWDVCKKPMSEPDGTVSEWTRVTCTDNNLYIGKPVHAETYGLITNQQFLDIVNDALLSVKGAKIDSVGSVCDRGRVFVSVSIPDLPEFRAAGREFRAYLNFINSHDQSSPFAVNASNVCVVCDNTFRYNLHDTNNKVFRAVVKHTKNANDRLQDIDRMIDAYIGTQVRFKHLMDSLDSRPVGAGTARNFFTGLHSPTIAEPSTQLLNKVDELQSLFRSGRGNRGQTLADVFSAVTDYYTHQGAKSDNPWRQIESSEYGFGSTMKTKTMDILSDNEEYLKTVFRGQKVLELV
jgi:hypothetical protein